MKTHQQVRAECLHLAATLAVSKTIRPDAILDHAAKFYEWVTKIEPSR